MEDNNEKINYGAKSTRLDFVKLCTYKKFYKYDSGVIDMNIYNKDIIFQLILDHNNVLIRKKKCSGFTTLLSVFSIWNLIYNDNTQIVYDSCNDDCNNEFIEDVERIIQELPDYIKERLSHNKFELDFSTKCLTNTNNYSRIEIFDNERLYNNPSKNYIFIFDEYGFSKNYYDKYNKNIFDNRTGKENKPQFIMTCSKDIDSKPEHFEAFNKVLLNNDLDFIMFNI